MVSNGVVSTCDQSVDDPVDNAVDNRVRGHAVDDRPRHAPGQPAVDRRIDPVAARLGTTGGSRSAP